MPRKNKRDPRFVEVAPAPLQRGSAPEWADAPGFDVRHVGGEKEYRCPGCDHVVRQDAWHLVVVPQDDVDSRRHWHTECWRSELRRTGKYRPSDLG